MEDIFEIYEYTKKDELQELTNLKYSEEENFIKTKSDVIGIQYQMEAFVFADMEKDNIAFTLKQIHLTQRLQKEDLSFYPEYKFLAQLKFGSLIYFVLLATENDMIHFVKNNSLVIE